MIAVIKKTLLYPNVLYKTHLVYTKDSFMAQASHIVNDNIYHFPFLTDNYRRDIFGENIFVAFGLILGNV